MTCAADPKLFITVYNIGREHGMQRLFADRLQQLITNTESSEGTNCAGEFWAEYPIRWIHHSGAGWQPKAGDAGKDNCVISRFRSNPPWHPEFRP